MTHLPAVEVSEEKTVTLSEIKFCSTREIYNYKGDLYELSMQGNFTESSKGYRGMHGCDDVKRHFPSPHSLLKQ